MLIHLPAIIRAAGPQTNEPNQQQSRKHHATNPARKRHHGILRHSVHNAFYRPRRLVTASPFPQNPPSSKPTQEPTVSNPAPIPLKRPTGKYVYLLTALLLLFIASPIAEDRGVGYAVLDVASTVILLATIYAISRERRPLYFALPLAAVTLLANWIGYAFHDHRIYIVAAAAYSVFFMFAAGLIIRSILREKHVTWDVVLGGASGYLLIGLTWANLFTLIGLIHPNAFVGVHTSTTTAPTTPSAINRDTDLIYFSFTTLTTLGYGDVMPVAHLARHMAALEGILGQFYLAVFVARLVGLHIMHSATRAD